MNGLARLALLYALSAALAIAVNLACQAAVIAAYHGPYAIALSILFGTAAGLPVKYALEKRYIFRFQPASLAHDGAVFVLYSFMGVFTTAIFWSVEYGFQYACGTDLMRYTGGAVGLTIGNIIKYQLDKRYVFVHRAATAGIA